MTDELKKVRKGTKSCTECRRRKVRCMWSSEEAPKCRRCEERGSHCVAQVYSLRTPNSRKMTSRDRIARLEAQVVNLSQALQTENGVPDLGQSASVQSDSDTSPYDSEESTGFGEAPQHLQTLFENDLIELDTSKKDVHELHRVKVLSGLSTAARRRLQELIPPKDDVEKIAGFAGAWLSLFHALFPAPTMIKSGQEMLAYYEAVKSSSVDPSFLASWLLTIAMTNFQVPKGSLGPEKQLKGFRNPHQFSRAVSDVVADTIMKHDALLGTIQGIDTAMLFMRMQLSRGNFKNTWLYLRRVIAVAELIGLHRAARRAEVATAVVEDGEHGNIWETPISTNARKAQVWESLCSVDRMAGMMFNLPPGTRRYCLPQHDQILVDGQLSRRAYLCSLSELAMKVQDIEDLEIPKNGGSELYSQILRIDGDLRVLASLTPVSWWQQPPHTSDVLLQHFHHYISLRVHLPFTLRHDTSDQYSFSRVACMKACQTLLDKYKILRSSLPPGFFLCRVNDLQCFTAIVVLILAYYAATPAEKANLEAQGSRSPDVIVPEILDFMKTFIDNPVANYARQAVVAVTALMQLLKTENVEGVKEDLKIKIPLLGKLHVRRKKQRTAKPNVEDFSANTSTTNTSSPYDSFPWDPLSWSIEDDQADVFQDAVMMEDFNAYPSWWDPNVFMAGWEKGP